MKNFNTNYNSAKVYSNSKMFKLKAKKLPPFSNYNLLKARSIVIAVPA